MAKEHFILTERATEQMSGQLQGSSQYNSDAGTLLAHPLIRKYIQGAPSSGSMEDPQDKGSTFLTAQGISHPQSNCSLETKIKTIGSSGSQDQKDSRGRGRRGAIAGKLPGIRNEGM